MILRHDYLEWIDAAPDMSDLKITAKAREGAVYEAVVVETDGFLLETARAKIVRGADVVDIHPLPAAGR